MAWCPHQAPPSQPEGQQEELPAASPPRPPSLLLLGINHVYKLWKNRDILQKKKNTKNIPEKKMEMGGLLFSGVLAAAAGRGRGCRTTGAGLAGARHTGAP